MSHKLIDRRDLHLLLFEMFDIEHLVEHEHYEEHSATTFKLTLDTAHQLAQELFWPSFSEFGKNPAYFDSEKTIAPESMHKIWAAFKEGGWLATSFAYEHGGQQFPGVVHLAACTCSMWGRPRLTSW